MARGNFSFRLEALVDLTDRLIKDCARCTCSFFEDAFLKIGSLLFTGSKRQATWALPSGLLDFSQAGIEGTLACLCML